jgi:hypothetical protein
MALCEAADGEGCRSFAVKQKARELELVRWPAGIGKARRPPCYRGTVVSTARGLVISKKAVAIGDRASY